LFDLLHNFTRFVLLFYQQTTGLESKITKITIRICAKRYDLDVKLRVEERNMKESQLTLKNKGVMPSHN
jgi:hypothetical protein